jgi:hypothetical protein
VASGHLTFRFRHRVDALSITNGTVDGVTGAILEPSNVERGRSSSRHVTGDFALRAQAVVIASGGIGGIMISFAAIGRSALAKRRRT